MTHGRTYTQSKIERTLTPRQIRAVRHWLFREKITYREMRQRLQERHGVDLSLAACSNFYRKHCAAAANRPARPRKPGPVLLDVILRKADDDDWRIQVLRRGKTLALHSSKDLKTIQS